MTPKVSSEYGDRVLEEFAGAPEAKRRDLWKKHEDAWRAATLMKTGVVSRDGLTDAGVAALMRLGDALGVVEPKAKPPIDPKPKL